jgi:serine phosphatase RsbU (regulator of sigma subunit)
MTLEKLVIKNIEPINMKKLVFFFIVFTLFCDYTYSQNKHSIDSLQKLLTTIMEDSHKVNLIILLSHEFNNIGEYEIGLEYCKQGLILVRKNNFSHGETKLLNEIAATYKIQGKTSHQLESYFKLLKIFEEDKNKISIANTFANIGDVFSQIDNYPLALKYLFNELKLRQEIGNKSSIANSYSAIGSVYLLKGSYELALKYELLALHIFEKLADSAGINNSYNNLGFIYLSQNNYPLSLVCFLKVLGISESNNFQFMISNSYRNIAYTYLKMGNYTKALNYYSRTLMLYEEEKYKLGIASCFIKIGFIYTKQNKYKEAEENLLKGLVILKETGPKEELRNFLNSSKEAYQILSDLDSMIALDSSTPFQERSEFAMMALKNYKQYIVFKDSINRLDDNTKALKQQMSYDFNKKVRSAKLKSDEEINKQKIVRNSFIGGFLIVLIISVIIFHSLQTNLKAKSIIEHQKEIVEQQKSVVENQKHIVEEKNREITESIEYALRIQTAILPPKKIVKQYLENSFILYKPKDIVAGDFYWMETVNDLVLFAACDCTGHGVPGAMVSVVCHNALNRAVREFGLIQPAAILDKTAEIVLENFSKSEEEIQDGMDISICALNTKTRTLEWAGANNSLLLIKNGQLKETKADKQCIGYNDNVKPFTNHQFNLQSDTSIYLFTDGFADQFGGQRERKLTKSKFKELLISMQHLPIQQQAKELDEFISNYKKETEQTDDILVIGVRV